MRQQVAIFLAVVALGVGGAGCGEPDAGAPTEGDTASVQPGVVKGKAVSAQGAPLANVEVTVSGTTWASGETNTFRTRTGADGRYTLSVPDGSYRIWGYHELTYAGAQYCMPLALAAAGDYDSFSSKAGTVRDFTWRISGMRADETDAASPTSYFGGHVRLAANSWDGWAAGDRFRVTFTPSGALIDGSTGNVITREATVGSDDEAHLLDIPVGQYVMTAAQLSDTGTVTPIKLDDLSAEPVESLAVTFTPTASCSPLSGVQDVVVFAKK